MIDYRSDDPKSEFFADLRNYLGAALSQRWSLAPQPDMAPAAQAALQRLQRLQGAQLRFLPQLALLSVTVNGQKIPFTLVHNSGHSNVSTLLFEDSRLLPEEDTISLAPGVLGAYPAAFFDFDETQLPQFVAAVNQLASEQDFKVLMDHFGIRRNAPQFWQHSDWVHAQVRQQSAIEAGVLDYNRFENR